MYIIVAGCGRVGSRLGETFSYEGHDVVVVDKDSGSFKRLGGNFNGLTVEGIAFDEEILDKAGIGDADAFCAVTNFDNTNLMAAEMASNIYQVPNVISRLYSPHKELTFFKMGIDYVCGTSLMADRIMEMLFQNEDAVIHQERPDIGLQIVEFSVGAESNGKTAGDLDYGVSSQLVMLLRDNQQIQFDDSTPLKPRDRIIITMRKEGWNVIRDCLGDDRLEVGACPGYVVPISLELRPVLKKESADTSVIVGGCSQVGSHLAIILAMEDYDVTVIDENPSLFDRLPDQFSGRTLEGNVYDEETLLKAGIEEADAFTSVTKFDNSNLMAAEIARHVFGVPHVLARLFNPDKEPTYQALGLNYLCGTTMVAKSIMERILQPRVKTRTSCFNNLVDLVEFECPEQWDNRTLKYAREKAGITFAYVVRRNTGFLPDDNLVIKKGDTMYGLAQPRKVRKLEKELRKS